MAGIPRGDRALTDDTVLAGDEHGSVTTLMALTPTGQGGMRIDPVPLAPRSDRDAFADGGGTPGTTYQALLRSAMDDERMPADHQRAP